jgi:subtilisin family serine protease
MNGMIVEVPSSIHDSSLADDPAVVEVMRDQRITLPSLVPAADGGSADGGSADGGWRGLAGRRSAGHHAAPFIDPVSMPPAGDRPWGAIRLLQGYYDPLCATYPFNTKAQTPKVVSQAMKKLLGLRPVVVKVAIFDTGVNMPHPNLVGKMHGGVDLVHMAFPTSLAQARSQLFDDNGHGTHVAGTIAARLQNDPFGLAPGVQLYSVKVLDHNACGDASTLLMGLQWAIDNHMDIINLSVAYAEDHPGLRHAFRKAHDAGIVMVAAVGNHSNWDLPAPQGSADGGSADGGSADGGSADGGSADGGSADGGSADGGSLIEPAKVQARRAGESYGVMYPAKYPEVIAVGAIDSQGRPASFSNSGPEVDLLAPGVNVISTYLERGFGRCSGTSMATPHVTSAVALMIALNPQLTPQEVEQILSETAVAGEVDLVAALERARPF